MEKIPWSQFVRYFGLVLISGLSEATVIREKLSCFYGQINYFIAKFKCIVTPDARAKLFT